MAICVEEEREAIRKAKLRAIYFHCLKRLPFRWVSPIPLGFPWEMTFDTMYFSAVTIAAHWAD